MRLINVLLAIASAAAAAADEGLQVKQIGYASLDLAEFNKMERQGRTLRGQCCKRTKSFNTTVVVEHCGTEMSQNVEEKEAFALASNFLRTYNKANSASVVEDGTCDSHFRRIDRVEAQVMGNFRRMTGPYSFVERRLVMYHLQVKCAGPCGDHFHILDQEIPENKNQNEDSDQDAHRRGLKLARASYEATPELDNPEEEECKCPNGRSKFVMSTDKFVYLLNKDLQTMVLEPAKVAEESENLRKKRRERLEKVQGKKVKTLLEEADDKREALEKLVKEHLEDKEKILKEIAEAEKKLRELKEKHQEDFEKDVEDECKHDEYKEIMDVDEKWSLCTKVVQEENAAEEKKKQDIVDEKKAREKNEQEQFEAAHEELSNEAETAANQADIEAKLLGDTMQLEYQDEEEEKDFLEKLEAILDQYAPDTTEATEAVELEEVDCPAEEDDFKREAYLDIEPMPDLSNDTVREALEVTFMQAYNDLAHFFCDPLHRQVKKVKFKVEDVTDENVTDANGRRLRSRLFSKVEGTCRRCSGGDSLYNDSSGRRSLEEAFDLSQVDVPHATVRFLGEDKCYCPKKYHPHAERAPYAREFAYWLNRTQEVDDQGLVVLGAGDGPCPSEAPSSASPSAAPTP